MVVIPGAATTQPQHDGIAAALGLWRQVGVASLTLEPEGVEQRVPIHFKESLAAIHGVYEPSIGEVRVNSKMADRALDITIAHELGHALGLPHVPASERSSVMNPSNSSVAPTSDDQRQLQALWSCLRSP